MENLKSLASDEGRAEYEEILESSRANYEALRINEEMEMAVIKHLEDLGVLTGCAVMGKCVGGCPPGQGCITTIKGNCVCSVRFTD